MDPVDPRAYCHSLVKASGSSFYYAFLFLPRSKREAIEAVYAFCRVVDDVVDQPKPETHALAELRQWRDELDACYAGRPRHPILQAVAEAVGRYRLPRTHFEDLLDGVEMDLVCRRYPTFEALSDYCYRVAGVVGLLCVEIFGYRNPAVRDYAVRQGLAVQLTNILRDLKADGARGRIYLPLEDLGRFGYTEAELLRGVYSPAFVALMEFQTARTRRCFQEAAALCPSEDRSGLKVSEMMGRIYAALLAQIEREQFRVFEQPITLSAPKKFGIALRTWLGRGAASPS